MSKFRTIRNSLTGGQISPTALGRTDLATYPHSCEVLKNMIPLVSGGGYRRPGTLNQDAIDVTAQAPPRLIQFIVSQKETYAIYLGYNYGGGTAGYAKVFRATGNSTGQVSISSITGSPPWVPYSLATYPNSIGNGDDDVFSIQHVQSADVMWLVHPTFKPQVIKRTALDTFTIGNFDAGLTGQDLVNAYPYLNQNTTSTTITPSGTNGNITLTASNGMFTSDMVGTIIRIYGGTSVGAAKITAFTSATVVSATTLVDFDSTLAKATWWESAWSKKRGWPRTVTLFQQRLAMGGTTHQPDSIWFSATANYFKFSALNESTPALTKVLANGTTVSVSSGTIHYPVDDAEGDSVSTGPTGLQPFRITLTQSQLDQLQWLSPDKELLVGTLSQEWIISPQNGDFSVGNSLISIQSKYGSDYLPAVRIGYELIFPMATQDEIRAYQYNYIDASFFAEPIQWLFDEYPKAETVTLTAGRRKFRHFSWDGTRNTLWCSDTSGNFFGMTRDRKLGVTMWHTHEFGGFDSTKGVNNGNTGLGAGTRSDPAWAMCDGSVVSFAVVPNPFSGINDIWLVIKRTVSGTSQWQVERIIGKNTVRDSAYSAIAPGGTTSTEPLLVDAATIQTDNGDGSIDYTAGTYLNGFELTGTYYSETYGLFEITSSEVIAGSTNLNNPLPPDYGALTPFHVFTLGLPYSSIVHPTRIDVGSVIGATQGAIKRINRCFVRFYKTLGGKIGSPPNSEDLSSLEAIDFQTPDQGMAQSPEVFTGDKKVIVPTTYDRDGYIYLTQDKALPFTLVSIVSEGTEFD